MLENLFQLRIISLSINFCMKLNPGLNTKNMATKQNNKAVCVAIPGIGYSTVNKNTEMTKLQN